MATNTTASTTTTTAPAPRSKTQHTPKTSPPAPPPAAQLLLKSRIAASPQHTPFQKSVWLATLQIPAGRVTTYNAVARHLRCSSPRAVGNALRRNPFAPHVPCHRVVAADATLGGFRGKVARRDGEGVTLLEKRSLLRREGVKFDARGRVLGTPFSGFV